MADPVAMLQSVLDPEMPLSERAAIKAAIDEIERLRALGDALAGYGGQPCECLRHPDDRLDDVCNPCKHRFAWLEARLG